MSDAQHLETIARELSDSGEYRVLRRLQRRAMFEPEDGTPTRLGIFLDLETTGIDPAQDEIIEIAMVPFTYALDGRIFEIQPSFEALRQPSKPIPPEIVKITGIDDAMVQGRSIDPAAVAAFAAPAAIVIAHNAAFDRRFAERFCEIFTTKAWGCSMAQVDWAGERFEGTKLTYLATQCGFFYDAHRAADDCAAALEILARPLPSTGAPALASLLETARKATWRIWAENSPFDQKDILKRRGYRWNSEVGGAPKAWFIDVSEEQCEVEITFLKSEIYRGDVDFLTKRITAYDRYSERC
ncbi:MAG: 3'-5' exonuclease [Aliidongia sp.]